MKIETRKYTRWIGKGHVEKIRVVERRLLGQLVKVGKVLQQTHTNGIFAIQGCIHANGRVQGASIPCSGVTGGMRARGMLRQVFNIQLGWGAINLGIKG